GAQPLAAGSAQTEIEPSRTQGWLRPGALADGQGMRCLRFEAVDPALADATASLGVPPVLWETEPQALARLDPRPLERQVAPEPAATTRCEPEWLPFGPGCARIFDERALVLPPDEALLWSIAGGGLDYVAATEPGRTFWLHPLPVERAIDLRVETADAAGRQGTFDVRVHTEPPMPHVVLNEVLANPLGPEPAQEWVELYNDSATTARLEGYVLVDGGGYTPLPPKLLGPRRYALVVNQGYQESNEFDPAPPEGVLLLRVSSLGSGGLSNEGEPLSLRDADGRTVSQFPAVPKPKSGESVLRIAPMAPDDAPSSFVRSCGPPTPGAANTLPPEPDR
ncbi:MAG: lamin tail domain-containing protein, partial [Deltaproteobacteria bacterium]|nr:lamin tail domain-containing protein [Deltaproteobacteria bacterium]MBW2537025.1 lamin tail domain-containing protein [Deltaproteobacteria bacterium]